MSNVSYFIDENFMYLGGFSDGAKPKVMATEVLPKPSAAHKWDGNEWVVDPTAVATQARAQRNALLQQSDWTQVADAPVDQAAWATYRQGLRDITAQAGFPENINWPTRPE
jgi:hypothetical protein